MTLALKSPQRRIKISNGPRNSHSPAWRGGGSRGGSLRCTQRLSRTPEDESDVSSNAFDRHLRYDNGAGTRGPSHGGTCRGRACSVPCTRAVPRTRASIRTNTSPRPGDLRDGPASSSAGELFGAVHDLIRGTDADEADADLQAEDRAREERCRFQEDPGEAKEALSEKRRRERGFLNPHSASFDTIDLRAHGGSARLHRRLP